MEGGTRSSYVTEIQDYFQKLRRLSEYDEKDGVAVGETFMIKIKEETKKRKGQLHKYNIRVAKRLSKDPPCRGRVGGACVRRAVPPRLHVWPAR